MRTFSLAAILLFASNVFAAPSFEGYWACTQKGFMAGDLYIEQTPAGLKFYEDAMAPEFRALGAIECPSETLTQNIAATNELVKASCDEHVFSVHSHTAFDVETQSDFSIYRASSSEIRIHFSMQSKFLLWWQTLREFDLSCTQ